MTTVAVITPSIPARFHSFLETALKSARAQEGVEVRLILAIDEGVTAPSFSEIDVVAYGNGQSGAVNAGVAVADTDYLAILFDDDTWHPAFLATALDADAEFVSSSQLDVGPKDNIDPPLCGVIKLPDGESARVFDYPMASGWVMRRRVWDTVGPFNRRFVCHPDTEWLGRLGETTTTRTHLVEVSAPTGPEIGRSSFAQRPGLWHILNYGRPKPRLVRHRYQLPLVNYHLHRGSMTERIYRGEEVAASARENSHLKARFGYIPW